MNGEYCMYLRKSRADAEAEQRGEGETLARHEAALRSLAKRQGLDIARIYREIVSGETIASRPEMRRLLGEVERGRWAGVLVMEVERLARGDTVDQGLVAQAFRLSGTRIITPVKTYDPSNEFDEEYFEFGLFMSRREYKAINRRLQRGRLASVAEGKYVANKAPYGYKRVKIPGDKGFTLEADEDRADVIRLIYDMFVNGEAQEDGSRRGMGAYLISRRLNEMLIPSSIGSGWTQSSVRDILINPVYMGKIRWDWRKSVRQAAEGGYAVTRPRRAFEDCLIADGLHRAIIPEDMWLKAQEIMASRAVPCTPGGRVTQNPLSGLIVCGKCGRRMSRRPDSRGKTPPSIICAATSCGNVSSYLHLVENKILEFLPDWLGGYRVDLRAVETGRPIQLEAKEKTVKALEEALETVEKQMNNLHDLLERGIYDERTFLTRSKALSGRRAEAADLLEKARRSLLTERRREDRVWDTPREEELRTVYDGLLTPLQKNRVLKEVLEKVVYIKETGGRWNGDPDAFTLVLYPRVREAFEGSRKPET